MRVLALALAAAVACASQPPPGAGGGAPAASFSASPGDADKLLPVDCLLPGRIRKLGRKVTYLTPRRPVRTTALDCEIRGGEYVAYDRADYRTALAVWRPQAEAGDPEAQNYVGEIYERGLGTEPDFAEAARWYRRAAEQGHPPALVNLGQLYERGLGVPRDPVRARELYARASGLDRAEVPFVPAGVPTAEVASLRAELGARDREAARLREELEGLRTELARARAAEGAAGEADARDREAAARERAELAELRRQVEEARAELAAGRLALGREREALAERERSLAGEREALYGALERAEGELKAELAARLEAVEAAAAAARSRAAELEAREAELGRGAEALRERESEVAGRAAELDRREQALAARERELAGKEARVAELERELEALRKQEPVAPAEVAALPGPTIQLIDPPLPVSRGLPTVRAAREAAERVVVGRVEAPAGLLALTVNDVETDVDARGLFRRKVPVAPGGTRVAVVAVDRQGKRAERLFRIEPEEAPRAGAAAAPEGAEEVAPPPIPAEEFGRFFALVIGNDDYRVLPDLDTAVRDAEAIGEVLATRYGFEVTVLRNATRYEILTALNRLRGELTERDNLMIYYAGHGELDEVNQRGHWLPVDAEPDNTANWISNVSLTDLLRAMSARHVLVVADSCYSGALTRSALARLEAGMTDEARVTWLRTLARKRSRTALTSGGLKPVLDGGGGGHSIFARALLAVLRENRGVLEGQRLFQEISARVAWAAEFQDFEQVPEYAPIKYAGHEAGDFFFVPRPAGGA